jgi:hypothetical protein
MMDEANDLSDLDQMRSRYEILRQLGHDGNCPVYAVRSRDSDRHFAVKIMDPPGSLRGKPGSLHLWQAHTVARLDHPKLMVLHAIHHLQGGAVAIAMERRPGRTLAERIEAEGPLPVAEAVRVLRDVAEALAYLHGRGIVHRNVSPHSVFLDRIRGHARLGPLRIDRTVPAEPTRGHRPAPTDALDFLAPEQVAGATRAEDGKVTARTDLYCLGLLGHAMLAGGPPWQGASSDTAAAGPKSDRRAELRRDVPDRLARALELCLQEDPRRRWSSADRFLAALDPTAGEIAPRPGWSPVDPAAYALERMRSVRSAVRRRTSRVGPRHLRIAAASALIGLVATGAIRGTGGASDQPGGDPRSFASPLTGSGAAEAAPPRSTRTDATLLPRVLADPPRSMSSQLAGRGDGRDPGSASPVRADPRQSGAYPVGGRRNRAADTAPSMGVVLLGDPVSRRSGPGLIGEPVRVSEFRR